MLEKVRCTHFGIRYQKSAHHVYVSCCIFVSTYLTRLSIFLQHTALHRNRTISDCFDITSACEPIKIGRLKSGRVRLT